MGTKSREAISYESSPGHLGLIVTGVIVLLPELLLNIVIRLLTSLTLSRLASQAVYCRQGVGVLGQWLQVVGQGSVLHTTLPLSIGVFNPSQLLDFFGL